MRNQSGEIPIHLRSEWADVSEKLRQASLELHEAKDRHHRIVLARIALAHSSDAQPEELEDITAQFNEANEVLQAAHVRYHEVVVARLALSRALNLPYVMPMSA